MTAMGQMQRLKPNREMMRRRTANRNKMIRVKRITGCVKLKCESGR